MAITWKMHQANYYMNQQLWHLSKKWVEAVSKWVLKHARQQWDHWNNKLHKWQPNQIKDLAVNANIQEQYNAGTDGMPRTLAKLFKHPVAHILQLSHNCKCQWLASVKAAWNRQRWALARAMAVQHTLLYNWLHLQQLPTPQPPPEPDPDG